MMLQDQPSSSGDPLAVSLREMPTDMADEISRLTGGIGIRPQIKMGMCESRIPSMQNPAVCKQPWRRRQEEVT